nr:hypothetical protein [Azospirillum sp. TSO5]
METRPIKGTRPRGACCGSVAWIGFDGAMDSSIVIRTLAVTTRPRHRPGRRRHRRRFLSRPRS